MRLPCGATKASIAADGELVKAKAAGGGYP
jgi:hypothetical protein